ncbi:transcriptional regulator, GntR family [Epibacterium ulvae]|uniref:Transcriptional regulator, GntR family n=1 Tax=Epibacterium ulvae TaxID=1156985 RepID=A0A1G5R7D5_9RHOB|nr:PLP-dependent aminotransferase family protein [Epibacterium ulvae]SCZ69690.1 transcriptional regulator, GntR family [Epibacterium ulvae]
MLQLPTLDTKATSPLYVQIVEAVRAQINAGSLAPMTRLPASRALATDLNISRSTCVSAYEQLIAEGCLTSKRGSGLFVAEIAPLKPQTDQPQRLASSLVRSPRYLSPGTPDAELFPARAWARTIAQVGREEPLALCERSDAFGDPQLRTEIAAYVARARGIKANPEQIIITSGAREALELAMETLIDGEDIALEMPGFSPTYRYAQQRHWPIRPLHVSDQGAHLPKTAAKITILTPSHQFPLGGAMPVAQRQHFLDAAQIRGGWIIEDDFDSEFRYRGQPLPAMAALDRHGRCLYVGTFSKTFNHALRLGYLILPPVLVSLFRARFVHPSAGAAITAQRPLARFMASGQYERHVRRARRIYAERYETACDNLDVWPAQLGTYTRHRAGMQIAFHLSQESRPDDQICQHAVQEGYDLTPLSKHTPKPFPRANGLLIGFCDTKVEALPPLLNHLQKIIHTV